MKKSTYKKVTLTMPCEMLEYLERIGHKSHRAGGLKLAKTEIVRGFITLLKALDIDWTGLKDEKDLRKRIVAGMRAYQGA
jgi:hypothetical protein